MLADQVRAVKPSLAPVSQVSWVLSRRACLSALVLLGSSHRIDAATLARLPSAHMLHDELLLALKGGHPLVVLVSLAGCPMCKIVRENYLIPLREQQGLPVVQVDMQSSAIVQDFKGVSMTHAALVHAWGIKAAPSVLFFGGGGTPAAPPLLGVVSPDYYGAVLDERLAQAQQAIKSP